MNKIGLFFDENTHTYVYRDESGERKLPSVSRVINQNERKFISPAGKTAMERGTKIHKEIADRLCECKDDPRATIESLLGVAIGDVSIESIETPTCGVINGLMIAGIPDVVLRDSFDEKLVIDWKTGQSNPMSHNWQITAYCLLVGAKKGFVAYLDKKKTKCVDPSSYSSIVERLCYTYRNSNFSEDN